MSASQWSLRPCTPGDLDQVARIYEHYVLTTTVTFEEEPPSPGEWAERLARAARLELPFLVSEEAGQILGYGYCAPWRPRPAYRYTVEDSVYLHPDHFRRGIGRALLTALLEGCARSGIRQVVAVIADTGDTASVALHERCGFRQAGRLLGVGYKQGRWLDTILLQRSLAPDRA